VFDENGLVLKTYDYEEMIDFSQNQDEYKEEGTPFYGIPLR
jgi:hypothetical protein